MDRNKKMMIFYSIVVALIILVVTMLLVLTIPEHIAELKSIRECAEDPECMRCAPGFEFVAPIVYIGSIILLVNATLLFKEILRIGKKK